MAGLRLHQLVSTDALWLPARDAGLSRRHARLKAVIKNQTPPPTGFEVAPNGFTILLWPEPLCPNPSHDGLWIFIARSGLWWPITSPRRPFRTPRQLNERFRSWSLRGRHEVSAKFSDLSGIIEVFDCSPAVPNLEAVVSGQFT